MAGPARVHQLTQQARTTFSKPKGEPSFQEEFERLRSVVSGFILDEKWVENAFVCVYFKSQSIAPVPE